MSNASNSFSLDRKPWSQPWCWCALSILALVIHYAVFPFVNFPLVFVIPVMLAAWASRLWFAVGLAVALSLLRFGFFFVAPGPQRLGEAALNSLIRCVVLVLIAVLTWHLARRERARLGHVKTLEGLLPICSFCKRIRDDQGKWLQIEAYISSHSEAKFSHSCCPDCGKEHYGELFGSRSHA